MDEKEYEAMLESVIALSNNEDFNKFMNWIGSIIEYTDMHWTEIKEADTLRVTQGKQMALRSIFGTVTMASKILEDMKNKSSNAGKNPNI